MAQSSVGGTPTPRALALALVVGAALLFLSAPCESKKNKHVDPEVYCSACQRMVKYLGDNLGEFKQNTPMVSETSTRDAEKRKSIYNKKQINEGAVEILHHLEEDIDRACLDKYILGDKRLKTSCEDIVEDREDIIVSAFIKQQEATFCVEIAKACQGGEKEYKSVLEVKEEREAKEAEKKAAEEAEKKGQQTEEGDASAKDDDDVNIVASIRGIQTLTSINWNQIVMDAERDVLVLVHKKGGPESAKVLGALEGVAKAMEENSKYFAIAAMDTNTDNPIYDFGVTDFSDPMVALFPANQKANPKTQVWEKSDLDGPGKEVMKRLNDLFLDFIRTNASETENQDFVNRVMKDQGRAADKEEL